MPADAHDVLDDDENPRKRAATKSSDKVAATGKEESQQLSAPTGSESDEEEV